MNPHFYAMQQMLHRRQKVWLFFDWKHSIKTVIFFSSCIMQVIFLLLFFVIWINFSYGQHLTNGSLLFYIIVGHISIYVCIERDRDIANRNTLYQIPWTSIYFHVCFEISKRETIYIHLAHIYVYGGGYRPNLRITFRIILPALQNL